MKVSKRKAKGSDKEFMRMVHHKALYDVVVRQFGKWDEKLQDEFFEDDIKDGDFEIILFDNEPCGYFFAEKKSDFISLREIIILPEYQNKNIGTFLIQELINESSRLNIPIKTGTHLENYALEFYKRHGFKEIGTNATHILLERPITPQKG